MAQRIQGEGGVEKFVLGVFLSTPSEGDVCLRPDLSTGLELGIGGFDVVVFNDSFYCWQVTLDKTVFSFLFTEFYCFYVWYFLL